MKRKKPRRSRRPPPHPAIVWLWDHLEIFKTEKQIESADYPYTWGRKALVNEFFRLWPGFDKTFNQFLKMEGIDAE